MSLETLLVFIPLVMAISLSPGLCMMLALNTGMRVGVRSGWPMVVGELTGVGIVATASLSLIAALIIANPHYFQILKYIAALWLLYSAWQSLKSDHIDTDIGNVARSKRRLAAQGFLTAIGNPKGWAFTAAFLPPFIDPGANLGPQLVIIVGVLLVIEMMSLYAYMLGGRTLRKWLEQRGSAQRMGAVSAVLLTGLAVWLLLS